MILLLLSTLFSFLHSFTFDSVFDVLSSRKTMALTSMFDWFEPAFILFMQNYQGRGFERFSKTISAK
jgi:hypothetical protein